jgi:hypothetical protein
MAMIRAEALGNHAIVIKELAEVRTDPGALRSDLGALRQTVDALPSVLAKMFVEHSERS